MITSQIASLACMAFGIEVESDPRRAVRRVQALLRSKEACAARIAFLAEMAARSGTSSSPSQSKPGSPPGPDGGRDWERFGRIADAILDRQLGRALRSMEVDPAEIDDLLRDPQAIVILHQGLTDFAPLASSGVTQVLVQKGWSAVEPILPFILDEIMDIAKVSDRRAREDLQAWVMGELRSIPWSEPPGRFRDLLHQKVNAYLVRHRFRAIPQVEWSVLVEAVALRGGLAWLGCEQKQGRQPDGVVDALNKVLQGSPSSVHDLTHWIESNRIAPRALRDRLRLGEHLPPARIMAVCRDLVERIRLTWAMASDVLEPGMV